MRREVREERRWRRGVRLGYVDWDEADCGEDYVEVDGYRYYSCDGSWFSRTYYGGEVVYTVTDPPPGY